MNTLWAEDAGHLLNLSNEIKETQTYFYLEQLMLFPEDIQDKIIEDISHLPLCTKEAIASIMHNYSCGK